MTVSVDIETVIARPPADVFAALIDVEHYPEWLIASGITRVERLDAGPLGAGSGLRISQTVAGRSTVLDGKVTVPRTLRRVRSPGQGQGRRQRRDPTRSSRPKSSPRAFAGRCGSACRCATACSNRWSPPRRGVLPPRSRSLQATPGVGRRLTTLGRGERGHPSISLRAACRCPPVRGGVIVFV